MTHAASAPFWVKALLVTILVACTVPGWLYLAGLTTTFVLFKGAAGAPETSLGTYLEYFQHHRAVASVRTALVLGAVAASLPLIGLLAALLRKPRQSLHGDARFARRPDIARAGLLDGAGDGIILGRLGKDYLTAGLDQYPHVLLAAPTGSGKGVGVVLPNLFNWNHSAIVLDIKKENWAITAGFRKAHGHQVFLFDPASPQRSTHRWNPLAYVRDDDALRVDDIQKIGSIIFPDVPNTDPIWTASCRSLFTGLVLYLFETEGRPRTLGQVAREAYSGDDTRWSAIIAQRQSEGRPLSDVCAASLMDYVNTSDNTRTSIRKTFTSRFELFTNPIIDAATAGNDFDLAALRKTRMTVYLGITPDNLGRLAPLLNLFFQQVVDLNTRELPDQNPTLKYQCLLLMDEFRALGKMQVIAEAIAYLRGYGIRLLTILQSPSQVREVYGDNAAKNFFQNHPVRICYTPADIDVATEISRELGNMTFKATSRSKPQMFGKGNRSQTESDQARALMLPQEVKAIGAEEALLFAKGCLPIRATKIRWYQDEVLKTRATTPPPIPPSPAAVKVAPEEVDDAGRTGAVGFDQHVLPGQRHVPSSPAHLSEEEAQALADVLFREVTR